MKTITQMTQDEATTVFNSMDEALALLLAAYEEAGYDPLEDNFDITHDKVGADMNVINATNEYIKGTLTLASVEIKK